ncbi:hypothetical protein PYWP30_01826 [Pyrobaculum sp. WP30]|nr:hypothetical protein PYWP30_01826 [Pyrobaculum sp. WP30]
MSLSQIEAGDCVNPSEFGMQRRSPLRPDEAGVEIPRRVDMYRASRPPAAQRLSTLHTPVARRLHDAETGGENQGVVEGGRTLNNGKIKDEYAKR